MDKEFEIRFNDLTERLKRIENNIEFSRIMSDVVFKLKKQLFTHLVKIYLYRNNLQCYDHWCNEIYNFLNDMTNTKKSKKGKSVSNKDVYNELFNDDIYFIRRYDSIISDLLEEYGDVDQTYYKNKVEEIYEFIKKSLKKILLDNESLTRNIVKETLNDYNIGG